MDHFPSKMYNNKNIQGRETSCFLVSRMALKEQAGSKFIAIVWDGTRETLEQRVTCRNAGLGAAWVKFYDKHVRFWTVQKLSQFVVLLNVTQSKSEWSNCILALSWLVPLWLPVPFQSFLVLTLPRIARNFVCSRDPRMSHA